MNAPPPLRSAAQLLQELRQYQEANTLYEDWALTTRISGGTASFVPPRPELPAALVLLLGLRPFQRPSEKQLAWLEQTLGEAVVKETIQPAKMAGSSTQSVSDLPSPEAPSSTSNVSDDTSQITDNDRASAKRKLSDLSKYPSMTAREVAAALGITRNAVYEHSLLEKYPTGNRKRLYTTASVLAILNSPPQ